MEYQNNKAMQSLVVWNQKVILFWNAFFTQKQKKKSKTRL
jgi:hypothetical protein